ncbi:MAG: oligosaccharide flippase family protein [Bacilli bacterium]|nr:oligosaccharide flippase family protein [Bacilli bacterium]
MDRVSELIKNTFIIAIGKFGTQVLNFLLLPLYTGYLSTTEYGNYDLVIVISSFLVPILTLLLEESMFRFLIDAKNDIEKKKIISNTFLYCFSICIVFAMVGSIFSYVISNVIIFYIVIYSISNVFIALSNAICRGTGKIKMFSISNFVLSIFIILLNIIFIIVFQLGFKALIFSSIISNLLVSISIFVLINIYKYISIKNFKMGELIKMIKYSWPLVPNTICWSIINLSDRLFIVGFLGTSSNGIYSVAYKFPNLINTFYSFFNVAWTESSAKILKDGNEKDKYNFVYKNIKKLLFTITLLLIASISFIFPLLVSESYGGGLMYIPILSLAVYYASLSGFFGGIYTAHKDTKILGLTSLIAALSNIIINFLFIKMFGLYTSAISTLISSYIIYIYRKKSLEKYVILNDSSTDTFNNCVLFIVTIFVFYFANFMFKIVFLIILTIYLFYSNKNILISLLFKKNIK